MHTKNAGKSQSGISIVEALVTMVILLIVMGGVYQIFQSNSLTYRMQQGMSRMQESGRFAMDFMINDIRMSGYLGCISRANSSVENNLSVTTGVNDYSLALGELDANELTIRRALDKRADILGISQINSTTTLAIDTNGSSFNAGEFIVLNNCEAVFITTASDSSNGTVDITGVDIPDSFMANQMGEILNVGAITYYVDIGTSGIPSLFRRVQHQTNTTQEIVEGIHAIRFLYRIDANNNLVGAGDVTDWNRVRSVQIALLAASPERIRGMKPDMTPYKFFKGTPNEEEIVVNTDDRRRMIRVFEASVGVRNRLQ